VNIGLAGQFASWAGSILEPEALIIVVAEDMEKVLETRTRLARVGLEKVTGYLEGGILAWFKAGLPISTTEQISVEELQHRISAHEVGRVIDVRRPAEWDAGHIAEALHLPLNHLAENVGTIGLDEKIAVICAGGFRSSLAASLLQRKGFQRVSNVVGGMTAWHNAKLPVGHP
jgi:rhodanese-related sulfurtransferase